MGEEQSLLPGIKFAERFADYGITGLSVSLFGADAKHKVMGMWIAYHDAYANSCNSEAARLHVEKTGARVLLIAGDEDEAWPAKYSVQLIEKELRDVGYDKDVKVIIYPHGSHLNGLMPNKEREKKLYRMIPIIGLLYKTFGKYRKENLGYFKSSEREIIDWIVR